jgi:hypothetical protein
VLGILGQTLASPSPPPVSLRSPLPYYNRGTTNSMEINPWWKQVEGPLPEFKVRKRRGTHTLNTPRPCCGTSYHAVGLGEPPLHTHAHTHTLSRPQRS